MSILDPMTRRWRRPVPRPRRHEPTSHVHVVDAELNRCFEEAKAMLRRPYDWSKDGLDMFTVAEPRACVSCHRGTSGRYVGDEGLIPLCPRCYGLDAIPTADDIDGVLDEARRVVEGEA